MKSHLMSHTRIHNIWLGMRQRCEKPRSSGYWKYGAKGIRVCEEWSKFEAFRDWAFSNGYDENLTLDRIDPNGNYEPKNCRWVTQKVQQNNRTNNVYLTYNGERKKLEDWAKETGISRTALYHRYKRGWDVERILTQKKRKSPTKKTNQSKVQESSLTVRFTDEIDLIDVISYIDMLPATDYESIEPYGKHSGIEVELRMINPPKKVFIYRNATGYVFDFRRSIYNEETNELKSTYVRDYRDIGVKTNE